MEVSEKQDKEFKKLLIGSKKAVGVVAEWLKLNGFKIVLT